MGQTSDSDIVVPPDWAAPEVKGGDDFFRYAIPFTIGNEKYLAVFSHRTEDISPIAGWAVKVDKNNPEVIRTKANWLMDHWLNHPEPVNTPKPTPEELSAFDEQH